MKGLSTRAAGPVRDASCILAAVGAVLYPTTMWVVVRFGGLKQLPLYLPAGDTPVGAYGAVELASGR